MLDKITRFLEERSKWKKAGSPVRSLEKINELFNICSSCEHFLKKDETAGSCNICGCNIINNNENKLNKLLWSTTRCPLENPKWIEESNLDNNIKENENLPAPSSTPAPTKKIGGCGCGG